MSAMCTAGPPNASRRGAENQGELVQSAEPCRCDGAHIWHDHPTGPQASASSSRPRPIARGRNGNDCVGYFRPARGAFLRVPQFMDKPVILAVDDDPQVLRQIGRDLVKHYGEHYSVLRADSGRAGLEALDELAGRAAPVALLLSDQRMPDMDGVSFLKQARRRYPDSKRALLTAYADTDAAIAAINESQVDYYLTKPWEPPDERLYPVVTDLLEDWRAQLSPRLRRPARRSAAAGCRGCRRFAISCRAIRCRISSSTSSAARRPRDCAPSSTAANLPCRS